MPVLYPREVRAPALYMPLKNTESAMPLASLDPIPDRPPETTGSCGATALAAL